MSADDFGRLHAALRADVDGRFLPGVATALLRGRDVVDRFRYGMADREAGVALRDDHLFRIFSSTKLVTSCAVMQLVEAGRVGLDDPIERWIPELGGLAVLRPGARSLGDTEAAASSITVRQLMTHTSGLSYGLFDPGSLLYAAYGEARVRDPWAPLPAMITALSTLPLAFQPGTRWEYSVATDVLGRLLEIVHGRSLGAVLRSTVFEPLDMVDTDFHVPEDKRSRLCAFYEGVDLMDPTKPGLVRVDAKPYRGAYLDRPARDSGGGGLVSTLGDSVRLLQSLIPGGPTLLEPETIATMFANQLPSGLCVQFPNMPRFEQRQFGLGSAINTGPIPGWPADVVGEVGWGGIAGTIWWINPRINIAAVLMTQRYFGFGNPYSFEFQRQAYRALGH